jgi:hypothetical protein
MADVEKIESWLAQRRKVDKGHVAKLVKTAEARGGELVQLSAFGADDPDDWCGTMRFPKPHPKVGTVVDNFVGQGWVVEVFPYGIISPEGVELRFRNQLGGRNAI